MNRSNILLVGLFVILFVSCNSDTSSNTTKSVTVDASKIQQVDTKFKILDPATTGIDASNKMTETSGFNYFLWSSIYMGSGVGVADFNNDGLPDIYIGQNMTQDKLYINKGDMKFHEISKSALPSNIQWTSGVSVVDINNDGWMDIYVCTFGPSLNPKERKNRLLINQKNNTFKEEAAQYGIDDTGFTTMATFFDVDKDGDKDLYVVNQPPDIKLMQANGLTEQKIKNDYSDKLYIRNKSGRYIDKTSEYGVDNFAYGLNVLVNDIDEDGWLDLYVSNDYQKPDHLYINKNGKQFVDELEDRTGHISNFAMGSDVADINNDGMNDIATLDMSSSDHYTSKTNMSAMNEKAFWKNVDEGNYFQYMFNTVQLNQGDGYYSEIAQMSGLAQTDWSWSIIFEDFNMDGQKDAYVTNGIKRDVRNNDFILKMKTKIERGNNEFETMALINELPSNPVSNYYYENRGDITFKDASKSSGIYDPDFSTGCAVADFDRDGDIDIIASVSEGPSKLIENQTKTNSALIRYSLDAAIWNEFLNAKFVIETDCGIQRKDLVPTRGYNSSSWDQVIFSVPAECEIINAYATTIYGDSYKLSITSEVHKLTSENLKKTSAGKKPKQNAYFTGNKSLEFSHKENTYNDFEVEILLPHKLSENGPCSASADVNGDGLEELFVGGSLGVPAKQFVNRGSKWESVNEDFWNSIKENENQGFTFLDVENDGDTDIYIVNGGNEAKANGNGWLTDQLLINDGKGNFSVDASLSKIGRNTSTALSLDIDNDGDTDIVVFGSHKIGSYPASYESYVLENQDGKLKMNNDLAIGLDQLQLVTSATVLDYNQDGKLDIVAVEDWSEPQLLIGDGTKIKLDSPTEFEGLSSWWTSVNAGDFNGDGRVDLVLGSFGDNNKFHPTSAKPLEVYGKDFDGSGSNDIVLAKHYNNKVVPTRGRECSSQQIPNIQDKFPTYNEFALAGIEDILGEENIKESVHKKINGLSHMIMWNTAEGWKKEKLPMSCQVAPLKDTALADVNGDGVLDIIGIGNHYGAEVETARYDGGYGWVLLGDKSGNMKYVSAKESGIWFKGDGRSLQVIDTKKGKELFAFFNNAPARSYKLN